MFIEYLIRGAMFSHANWALQKWAWGGSIHSWESGGLAVEGGGLAWQQGTIPWNSISEFGRIAVKGGGSLLIKDYPAFLLSFFCIFIYSTNSYWKSIVSQALCLVLERFWPFKKCTRTGNCISGRLWSLLRQNSRRCQLLQNEYKEELRAHQG